MKLIHSWVKEFVSMPQPKRVQEVLDAAGLPVESITSGTTLPATVVVGHVLTCSKHPQADRLSVTTVDVGEKNARTIVCGAPNIATGQNVPVALPGTKLPNGITIKEASIRGIVSSGMICAEDELGLGTGHSGILVLQSDAAVGSPLGHVLPQQEIVYDVSVTPNRSDCLSVIGLAREIAAAQSKKIVLPRSKAVPRGKSPLRTRIVAKECLYYSAQLLEDVRVRPSPDWMARRLQAAGVRPINNVVDITNYVMLELGVPLHAFDARTVAGNSIIVRHGKAGERLAALDGRTYDLGPKHLLITDPEKPIALAGVMGGQQTGITQQTTSVILEAALFHPARIHATSRQLGLVSESSQRFAKGVDPQAVPLALARARELFVRLCHAVPRGGPAASGRVPHSQKPVSVSAKRVNAFLGTTLPAAQMKKLLTWLQFTVRTSGDRLSVIPPSHRHDIAVWEDVAEEVARLHGYDAIPATLPVSPGTSNDLPRVNALMRAIAEQLARCGAYEHVGYAYVPADNLTDREHAVRILNPLSRDQEYLRTSLLPGLFTVAAKNAKRFEAFRLYEFGSEYRVLGRTYEERPVLACVWHTPQALRDLKGALDVVFRHCGVKADIVAQSPTKASINVRGQTVGTLILPTDEMLRRHKLARIAAAVIGMNQLLAVLPHGLAVRFHSLPQYPEVKRDIAFWVEHSVRYADIEKVFQTDRLLVATELFDVFTKGEKTSYALHLTFRAHDHTMTSAEADAIVARLARGLEHAVRATIRTSDAHV
ncbi:MAG: phenylalanine--tRNA ligase subunit beta [Candidatus Kerfeldbacteria bacterium]|nr:phenylalanine--tRNA ligase subunit beta [Candidatus Kerfeldbacteria bacterium]